MEKVHSWYFVFLWQGKKAVPLLLSYQNLPPPQKKTKTKKQKTSLRGGEILGIEIYPLMLQDFFSWA